MGVDFITVLNCIIKEIETYIKLDNIVLRKLNSDYGEI